MIAHVRSLDSFRIIVISGAVFVMTVTANWKFDDSMQTLSSEGRFEPFSAARDALIIAICVGIVIFGVYTTLMNFYDGDIKMVQFALASLVVAICVGLLIHWIWSSYLTAFSAEKHIVTKVTYVEDATLVALLGGALVFAVLCAWCRTFVHRS